MDETYAEDSFVVGSEVEEPASSEEEAEEVELLPEASLVDGKRQYATRRRVFLHKASAAAVKEKPTQKAGGKTKHCRIIHQKDSSEEEEEETEISEKSLAAERGVSAPLWPEKRPAEVSPPQPGQRGGNASAPSSKLSLLAKRVLENRQKERRG